MKVSELIENDIIDNPGVYQPKKQTQKTNYSF